MVFSMFAVTSKALSLTVWTSFIGTIWKLVRNAKSQAPAQTHRPKFCNYAIPLMLSMYINVRHALL